MEPSPTPKPASAGRLCAQALVLAALVGLAYSGVRHAGFIWDDDLHLTRNPCIIGPLGLKEVWTSPAANYFPLVLTNFWVQHALWGLAPAGYHAVTMGFLVGEVVRRVTGKSLGTVFREEIAEPLGADFWIGLPPSEDARVAELIPPPPGQGLDANLDALNEIQKNWIINPLFSVDDSKTRGWRAAELGASNGQGNARSIALVHTILANGGVANGKRFLSEAGCRKALELQVEGTDLVISQPLRFGLGFGLTSDAMPFLNKSTMFWGGYGGSIAIIDMQNRMSFGYAMNKMAGTTTGDMRALGLFMGALQAVSAAA